jgi:hypothetical protein
VGRLLTFEELSDYEKRQIHEEVAKDIRVRTLSFTSTADATTYDQAMLDVLGEWGVMCNHPRPIRLKSLPAYSCGVCNTIVLKPEWVVRKKAEQK